VPTTLIAIAIGVYSKGTDLSTDMRGKEHVKHAMQNWQYGGHHVPHESTVDRANAAEQTELGRSQTHEE